MRPSSTPRTDSALDEAASHPSAHGPILGDASMPRVELNEIVVRRHQRDVWRHLRFLGAPAPLADDLTQETFLRLLREPVEDRGEAALAAWLRATARHLFFDQGRRRGGLELSAETELEAAWTRWVGSDGGESALAVMKRCLARLEGRARRALQLRYAEGMSREAVAEALGLGVEGLKTLLRRGKQVLAACVRDGRARNER